MLEGEIIFLRAIEEKDLPLLMEWRNNPSLRRYFREASEINVTKQNRWFESINSLQSVNKMFSIVNTKNEQLLGACGLCHIDWINRSADFSIYIGYNNIYIDNINAVEAAKIMQDYAFDILNLHRLWAEIYSIDEQKKVFFNSIGFRQDAVMRETYWFRGQWHDSIFFSRLSTDG